MTGLSRSRIEAIIHKARKKLEANTSNDTCVITSIPETLTDKEKEALIAGYVNARC